MRTAILAGLRAHVRRLIATGLAVMLGVGFVAGTLIFGDTATSMLRATRANLSKNAAEAVSRKMSVPATKPTPRMMASAVATKRRAWARRPASTVRRT